jgi:1,4-dihydroxy-2-naphthoyl-CoA hydrolase
VANRVEDFASRGKAFLPGFLGIEFLSIEPKRTEARLPIRREFLAPNGFLHAAAIIALADTACGYGAVATMAEKATGFTTIELKSNFLGTALEGVLRCIATCLHAGRSTQVWDAVVTDESNGRIISLFRCTQMILYGEKQPA